MVDADGDLLLQIGIVDLQLLCLFTPALPPHRFPVDRHALILSKVKIVFEDIAKSSFQGCVEQLRKRYQIILLDCSPILPLADASIISSKVDGTILVERELISHRRDIASAFARLSSAGGKPFGFVFIGSMDNHNHKYESYYYSHNRS